MSSKTHSKKKSMKSNHRRHQKKDVSSLKRDPTAVIWKAPNDMILPMSYFTKLKTVIAVVAGVTVNQPFSATGVWSTSVLMNDIYQPFNSMATTAGITVLPGYAAVEQPRGYNSLIPTTGALYRVFQVISAKLKITNSAISFNDPLDVAITATAAVGTPANLGSATGQPWTKVCKTRGYGGGQNVVSLYVPQAKFIGIDKKLFEADQSGQSTGGFNALRPTAKTYFQCNFQLADAAQNATTIPLMFELTQYVRLFGFVGADTL